MNSLTDAQIRSALKSFGVDSIGPINAATRGAYLKKLERLQKATNGVSATGKTSSQPAKPDVSSVSQEHSSRSRSSSASRRSARLSPPNTKNVTLQSFGGIKEGDAVNKPVLPPAKPNRPPTSTLMNQLLTDILPQRPNAQNQTSLQELNKTKIMVPQKNLVAPQKPIPREISSRVVVNHNKPESSSGPKPTSLGTSFGSSTVAYPESEVVEEFRSKLRDESLWLNKFSLDTNLAARRRPLAESSRISTVRDYGTWQSTTRVPRTSWKENVTKKFTDLSESITQKCTDSLEFLSNLLPGSRNPKQSFGPTEQFMEKRTTSFAGKLQRSAAPNWRHRFQFDPETPRCILVLLVSFLSLIFVTYFCVVYRDQFARFLGCLFAAGADTVDFVYKRMILPVMCVAAVSGGAYGIFWYKRRRWHQVAEEQRKIFEMVEQIISILKKYHEETMAENNDSGVGTGRPDYLAVPHVRDMLIPPNRRNELYPIWDKAVEYLNENESRIRTENQCISGEEFMVWRWLQAANASFQKPEERQWQGYALPEADIANNSPKFAFFECLKLRGLFDPTSEEGADWPEEIQDAILEKLGPNIRVLHLALDLESTDGCVYMKMASKEEAGEAFKVLNALWFNGRLVSVKYLRPERYHQRFPDALKAYIPLSAKKPRRPRPNNPAY